MIKTTGILIQEYNSYLNPKMKIGRLVKEGKLIPIIKGLYETDSSIPGIILPESSMDLLIFLLNLLFHGII